MPINTNAIDFGMDAAEKQASIKDKATSLLAGGKAGITSILDRLHSDTKTSILGALVGGGAGGLYAKYTRDPREAPQEHEQNVAQALSMGATAGGALGFYGPRAFRAGRGIADYFGKTVVDHRPESIKTSAHNAENCAHCNTPLERGDDGTCNRCGENFDKKAGVDWGHALMIGGTAGAMGAYMGYQSNKRKKPKKKKEKKPPVSYEDQAKMDEDEYMDAGLEINPELGKKAAASLGIKTSGVLYKDIDPEPFGANFADADEDEDANARMTDTLDPKKEYHFGAARTAQPRWLTSLFTDTPQEQATGSAANMERIQNMGMLEARPVGMTENEARAQIYHDYLAQMYPKQIEMMPDSLRKALNTKQPRDMRRPYNKPLKRKTEFAKDLARRLKDNPQYRDLSYEDLIANMHKYSSFMPLQAGVTGTLGEGQQALQRQVSPYMRTQPTQPAAAPAPMSFNQPPPAAAGAPMSFNQPPDSGSFGTNGPSTLGPDDHGSILSGNTNQADTLNRMGPLNAAAVNTAAQGGNPAAATTVTGNAGQGVPNISSNAI